jgi:hypothetical protein
MSSRLPIAIILAIGLLLLLSALVYSQFGVCLQTKTPESLRNCYRLGLRLEPAISLLAQISRQPQLEDLSQLLLASRPLQGYEDLVLGIGQSEPTTYLVLLQNDKELRANGGFIGSYAVVSIIDGSPSIRFQDIYVPDGQLKGHIDPPKPIQDAFKQGWWKLRDADWYPDFPSAARTIRWFFDQGGEIDPDFLLTLNLATIEAVLRLTGPIEVADYQLVIDSNNIYQILQTEAEVNFFPGSTQKKDALTAIGKAFGAKINQLSTTKQLEISRLLLDQLDRGNLLVNAKEAAVQNIFLELDWAGQLYPVECPAPSCRSDSLAIVETNLGANKANCCLQRLTTHQLKPQGEYLVHEIELAYTNSSYIENPAPPDFYGGNYIQYLRIYLPPEARFVELSAEPSLLKGNFPQPFSANAPEQLSESVAWGFKEYGFFHITQARGGSKVRLSYSLPIEGYESYQLSLLKQHGLVHSPQIIYWGSEQFQTDLTSDYSQIFDLNQRLD